MRTFKMKVPARLSMPLRHVARSTIIPFKKIKAPLYLSLMGVVAITGTSFKRAGAYTLLTATRNSYRVLVVKAKYELQIYDSTGEWLVTYPVVFGNKDLSDKM